MDKRKRESLITGLKAEVKKTRERYYAWYDRYTDELEAWFYVNGDPDEDWIVCGHSLYETFCAPVGGEPSDWENGVLDDTDEMQLHDFISDALIANNRCIYRRTNHWYAENTKQAIANLNRLEIGLAYWEGKKHEAEEELYFYAPEEYEFPDAYRY